MKLRRLSIISFILIAVMLLAGCASSATTFPEESEYSPEALALGTVNRFAGVVIASGETKIEKDESRNIASIAVSAGDSVIAGQVLFTYDGSQAQNNYDKAAIELQQMQITLESYTAQKSQLEAEKAAASQEEQLAYTVQIQELDTTIRETSYNITLKQKEVDALKAGLGELEVKAPSDGKIQSVNSEGGTDANGNPLPFMVLVRTKAYRVKAQISEENISDLSIGDPVLIRCSELLCGFDQIKPFAEGNGRIDADASALQHMNLHGIILFYDCVRFPRYPMMLSLISPVSAPL